MASYRSAVQAELPQNNCESPVEFSDCGPAMSEQDLLLDSEDGKEPKEEKIMIH